MSSEPVSKPTVDDIAGAIVARVHSMLVNSPIPTSCASVSNATNTSMPSTSSTTSNNATQASVSSLVSRLILKVTSVEVPILFKHTI